MSTPEPVDPLVQLEADEAADRASAAEPVAAEPPHDPAAEGQAADATLEPAQEHPWATRFKSPEDMWQSYQNAEQKIREQGEELGDHRQFRRQAEPIIQQIAQQNQQQPQYGQQPQTLPDGTVIVEAHELEQAVEDGRLTEFQASMIWGDQQAKVHAFAAAGQFRQELEPLRAAHVDRGAQDVVARLNKDLGGDVVERNAELVREYLDRDRAHYSDPQFGYERMRQAIRSAELDRLEAGEPRAPREPIRDVHVEGGSGAQPQMAGGTRLSPEEQEIVDSLTWSRPVDEQGIPLPQ